ncbi:hypothetical protein C8D88_1267 [Lentzea atacamensis]|uniref:Uncharacterized protein n=1 Tax=Lentzea atacamensis TaxID=531938 RepID=A0A316HK44_9PSEU|nr:hypothetical protein [Lentzea atacamensis]PWK78615.1 hypothetical protein C8D88_1267 [Lentzea atacamensis]
MAQGQLGQLRDFLEPALVTSAYAPKKSASNAVTSGRALNVVVNQSGYG